MDKCLLCAIMTGFPIPSTTKGAGCLVCTCNHSPGEAETGEYQELLDRQSAKLECSRLNKTATLKKGEEQSR